MRTITVNATISDLTSKIKQRLAIVGKRAKDTHGNSLFSDITTTSKEDALFVDLVRCASESLVAELPDFTTTVLFDDDKIIIKLSSTRWPADEDGLTLCSAISDAVTQYLHDYATGQYLAMIHPSTGEKYPPIYGSPYSTNCQHIISNIYRMSYLKKTVKQSSTYEDVKFEIN